MIVKIVVLCGVLSIIRHPVFRGPTKGPEFRQPPIYHILLSSQYGIWTIDNFRGHCLLGVCASFDFFGGWGGTFFGRTL